MFPDAIYILGIPFRVFGLVAALSIFLGYYQVERELIRSKLQANRWPDLSFFILVGAFLFARLFFVFGHFNEYKPLSWDIFKIWEGGIVLYGGLLGGLLGGFAYCRFQKLSFASYADAVALGLALGLSFSRLGCFAAGCCYGRQTAMPFGVTFDHAASLAQPLHVALHPTQIYSFVIGMVIYAVLLRIRRSKTFEGEIILSYLILASVSRFFVDCFRGEIESLYLVSALAVFSISFFVYFQNQRKTQPRRYLMKSVVARLACFFLIAFVVTACGIVRTQKISRGLDISTRDVQKIEKGVTTEKEVIKLFGPPTKVRDTADGQQFFYEYTKTGGPQLNLVVSVGGGTLTKTLMVWLDTKGVVTDYAYKAS